VRAAPALVAVLSLAGAARGQTRLSLSPGLSVSAGYDDNLFLDPTLTSATPPRADAVIDVRPSLAAAIAGHGHALTLQADYLERITPSNGDLRDLLARLAWSSPAWHRLSLAAGTFYEHYEATAFPDNTFDLGGGDLALRLTWSRARFEVAYRIDARGYSDTSRNGQLDLDQYASASARVRLHPSLVLDVGYRFLDVASDEPTAVLERHRGDVGLAWQPTRWLSANLGYALWLQTLPNGAPPVSPVKPGGPRRDIAHALGAVASIHVRRWLDVFARYDFLLSTSDQPTGRYRLDQVVAGVAVEWTFAHERTPPPPPLLPSVNGHEVTFRARARPGAVVAVVGDWAGWQPLALTSAGGDRYEGTYILPSGRHAWALQVDGAAVTPPEARGFVDDGFGGRNAIVDVP
jgi:hypothetical protein